MAVMGFCLQFHRYNVTQHQAATNFDENIVHAG